MTIVKILRPLPPHNVGEIAGFEDGFAELLITPQGTAGPIAVKLTPAQIAEEEARVAQRVKTQPKTQPPAPEMSALAAAAAKRAAVVDAQR